MFTRIYARIITLDPRLILAVLFAVAIVSVAMANNVHWVSQGTLVADGPIDAGNPFLIKPNANWDS